MSASTLKRRKRKLQVDPEVEVDVTEEVPKDAKEALFKRVLNASSDDDVMMEYNSFLRGIPITLPLPEKDNLVQLIGEHLKIKEVSKRVFEENHEAVFHNRKLGEFPILDSLSALLGFSWRIIAPPTQWCLHCKGPLEIVKSQPHKSTQVPTQVKLHNRHGSTIASKYIFR